MTLAALIDAGADVARVNAALQSLGLPGVRLSVADVKKNGFRALKLVIEHEPEHKHRHLHHIRTMIDGSSVLSARQKELATQMFLRLAEAEAKVHGSTMEKVHFHEVGAVDSICDIVGVAVAWDLLGIEKCVCSPVPTGTGFVEIAHGRCAIPAPATAELLTGIPLAASDVPFELTTPTGATIVKTLASEFGSVPAMTIGKIGYGAGTRDLPNQPNLLRVLIGETAGATGEDEAWLLETNLDDCPAETLGYAIGLLWQAGAMDVYTTAIQMKKDRPGTLLSVLCHVPQIDALQTILLKETTTLGVRRYPMRRTILSRRTASVATLYGEVQGVIAMRPQGERFKPEFAACKAIAEARGVALADVTRAAQVAWEATQTHEERNS
jgi:uncharacterized protein (TIGR00299 family) protein